MASYRSNPRLGERVREIRAATGAWLGAAILAAVFAVSLGYYAVNRAHASSAKELIGALGLVCFSVWSVQEWRRLRRMVVHLHEHGLRFEDGAVKRVIAWEDVTMVQAQYVPGALGKGIADEGNLVALVLLVPAGQVSLPKELSGFSQLAVELKSRIVAPWRRVLLANLTARG